MTLSGAEPNILAAMTADTTFEILNVANDKDNTVLSLLDALNKIIGKDIKAQLLPVRAGDVFKTLADITNLKRTLNFKPLVNFDQGLQKTVEYFRNLK